MSESTTQAIAYDTLDRTEAIVLEHAAQGATTDSTFVQQQLPPLDRAVPYFPNAAPSSIDVVNLDSYTAARDLIKAHSDADGKIAVLNLASDMKPGGGWLRSLTKTQEEALCYSSTLYSTLKERYYPWPNVGPGSTAGVFSPGVVIFKDDLDHQCMDLPLEERRVVSVITVAAPCAPHLSPDRTRFRDKSVLNDFREKVRLVYRMTAHNRKDYLVLGAMGCGAYGCPPEQVANEMKAILSSPEFAGWFKRVVFAVYGNPGLPSSIGNFNVFKKNFENCKTQSATS
ncbi:hypothetical protein FISHEDRAFT_67243 [Fistulina hepatica ATCC 64428]|uniref:Microbial-type PARG catalytic domain-containing protein n=1 Tax=Fistulina hepatica ATCC 64428 TaxID=1128425 RepID=A0A0D7A1U6_9AGAR|nr:hypothetical protein FISHEDRAFT_67243 [Fistulina hepatica ATCC 64428]